MKATVKNFKEEAPVSVTNSEKSELMQNFEYQVNDLYWAYKDLLKAIFENE